ncbi:GNAT family N-acetyltransferase [Phycisphaerales bacterium AB-hyl4]|uniref:GNAT family N-acetyltransferase n=1 Tax=Natronomicrosphaera hydrolytica TaxID=3242702 RepID=A0ABV4U5N2_9BACT
MTSSSHIVIRTATVDDYPQIIALVNETFGKRNDLQWLEGFHKHNPSGRSILSVADHPSEGIVAYRSLVRFVLYYAGEAILCGQGSDAATRPQFQGQGLYSRMTQACIDQFFNERGSLLYSFPGPQSYPILVKRFGYTPVKRLRHVVFPLTRAAREKNRIARSLVSIYGRLWSSRRAPSVNPIDGPLCYPEAADPRKARFSRTDCVQAWRFQAIGRSYRCVWLDGVDGFLVIGSAKRRRLNICTIVDVVADDTRSLRQLLRAVVPWASQNGYDLVYTWQGTSCLGYLAAGFMPIPRHTNFVVKVKDGFAYPELLKRGDLWDISLLDTDAY